jgi:hypothetical protein
MLGRACLIVLVSATLVAAAKNDLFSFFPINEEVAALSSPDYSRSINMATKFEDLRISQAVRLSNNPGPIKPTTKNPDVGLRFQLDTYYKYLHAPQEALFHTYDAEVKVFNLLTQEGNGDIW